MYTEEGVAFRFGVISILKGMFQTMVVEDLRGRRLLGLAIRSGPAPATGLGLRGWRGVVYRPDLDEWE